MAYGEIRIRLPYPPSVNKYWRRFRGRMVLSKSAQAYRSAVAAAVLEQMGYRRAAPIRAGVSLRLVAHPPDRRRRDLDNLLKAILDAIVKAGIIADDSQVHRLAMEWGRPDCQGRGMIDFRLRVLNE